MWRTACALGGLVLLAGCGKAPKGQIIAIVNGQEITLSQLDSEARDLPNPQDMDRKALRSALLEGLIDRTIEVQTAREQGLDKTPEYRALKLRNEEELLTAMLGHQVAQGVPLPADAEIRAYMHAHPLQFARRQRLTLDQLSFTPPRDRRRLAAALANVHSLDAAAMALQSIGIVAQRGTGAIDTAQADETVAIAIDRAPPGEPILLPQGDRLVVGTIAAREPIEAPADDARLAAARAVRAATLLRESQAQIAAARSTAKISYEPGFEPDKAAARTQ